jgi:uncharacterized membrane protein
MTLSSRLTAFATYLLLVLGWIYVIVFGRGDRLAVYHLKQSVGLLLFLILTTLIWGLTSWLLSFIPLAGALFGVILFTLVICAYIVAFILWILGMIYALQGRMSPLPMIGQSANRLPLSTWME